MGPGGCDLPEVCNGVSVDCPANAVIPAGYICRFGTESCDATESCDGVSSACPVTTIRPAWICW